MGKKISKILGILLMVLFIISMTKDIYAREIKSLSDLGTEIEKINKDAEYAYVIGNYVFTSGRKLTTQDVMLAARTIGNIQDEDGETDNGSIYGKMTIHKIEKDFVNNTGWKEGVNLIGTTKWEISEDNPMNIRYIDYTYIKDQYTVTFKDSKGGNKEKKLTPLEGDTIDVPEGFAREGYKLMGWYTTDPNTLFDFNKPITENLTLNAKWAKLPTGSANNMPITATVGTQTQEFGVKTDEANDFEGKLVYATFKITKGEDDARDKVNIEYYETADGMQGWKELSGNYFGPEKGFPLTTGLESKFKYTFIETGTYNVVIEIKDKATEETYITIEKEIVVNPAEIKPNTLVDTLVESLEQELLDEYQVEAKNNNITVTVPKEKLETLESNSIDNIIETIKTMEDYKYIDSIVITYTDSEEQKQTINGLDELKTWLSTKTNGELAKIGQFNITVNLNKDTAKFENEDSITKEFTLTVVAEKIEILLDKVSQGEIDESASWRNWKQGAGYLAEFKQNTDNALIYEASGLITIFDDETWLNGNPIEGASKYYLVFKLKKAEDASSTGTPKVLFLQGDQDKIETITGNDFGDNNEIYVLKYLDPQKDSTSKQFDITIDLDKDNGHDSYDPYTLTIDWSNLKFQYISNGKVDFEVANKSDFNQKDLQQVTEEWNFDFDLNNVTVKTENDQEDGTKIGIKGTVREQTLAEGVFSENKGYYVPIKISFPKNDKLLEGYKDKWTIILNNEDDTTREVTPTSEDYSNGYITVLFKIYENGRPTNGEKKIKYQIDFDGPSKEDGTSGYDFLPYEYEIDYSDGLVFETDIAVVRNETELTEALKNLSIKTILIGDDFSIKNYVTINRNVTIKSKVDGDVKTITSEHDLSNHVIDESTGVSKDTVPVFIVSAGVVNFENLKIKGATRAISITNKANVTAKNVEAIDSADTAFDVAQGTTFTGSGLKYTDSKTNKDKESYNNPTICGTGTVNLDVAKYQVNNYKRIIHRHDGPWTEDDFKDPETGKYFSDYTDSSGDLKQEWKDKIASGESRKWHPDELVNTGHTHYYLKQENSTHINVVFRDSFVLVKIYARGEELIPPLENYGSTGYFRNVIRDTIKEKNGEQVYYVHDGWSQTNYKVTDTKGAITKYNIGAEAPKLELNTGLKNPGTLYPRYVEGYSVKIDVTSAEETTISKFFGVKKTDAETGEGKKIEDLYNEIDEFKDAWDALMEKSNALEDENKGKIYDQTTGEEVTKGTKIDKNLKLVAGKPAMVTLSSAEGYSLNGNKIIGTIENKNASGNNFTVNLSSKNFVANKTIVKVTNPNGELSTYEYKGNANLEKQNNITKQVATTVANEMPKEEATTVSLKLEALKKSDINSGNKVYKIAVDVDGENEDKFIEQEFTINYEGIDIAEEIINQAAANTQNAINLTLIKNNKSGSKYDKFTQKYDKDTNTSYTVFENEPIKYSYTFTDCGNKFYTYEDYLKLYKNHTTNQAYTINVEKQSDTINVNGTYEAGNEVESENIVYGGFYKNGWRYNNIGYHGFGISEVELLRDVISQEGNQIKSITAISSIEKGNVSEENETTYTVTVSNAKLINWLNNNYAIFASQYDSEDKIPERTIEGEVTLTVKVKDGYITSIESNEYTVNQVNTTPTTYKIDVKINNIGTTEIENPYKMILGSDKTEADKEELETFIEAGKNWWSKNTGSSRADK